MYKIFFELSNGIGIIGVLFILIAYFMLNAEKWTPNHVIYQFFNLSGACLILFSLFFHWNLSSVLIEIAWITISLISVSRNLLAYLRKKSLPVVCSAIADKV